MNPTRAPARGPRRRGVLAARRAFTLIELLTVIAIIAVLTGIGVPALHSAIQSSRKTRCGANLSRIATALAQFAVDERHYPASLDELAPEYIDDKAILHCRNDPIPGRDSYDLFYARRANIETGESITCACGFHPGDDGWLLDKGGDLRWVKFQSAAVRGSAEMRPRESTKWVAADRKRLRPGDRLRTRGGCAVQFDDGTVLTLGKNTELTIAALTATHDGGSITAVGMYVGEVYAQVKHLLTRDSVFEIVTPSAVTGVRGTSFSVKVPPNGDTDVSVCSGSVRVTTWDSRRYTLGSRQKLHISGADD